MPPEGEETGFASLCATYETLLEERKARLDGLVVEHSLTYSRARVAPNLMSEAFLKETRPVNQALVRTIPESGKKAVSVGPYAARVIDWPIEKGKALLQELLEWATQSPFVYRHSWQANDLLVYDNRCCLHRGRPWERGTYKRIRHRTTLAGDGPTAEQDRNYGAVFGQTRPSNRP